MTFPALLFIGVLVGLTTVLFGFGGGFVAVPVIVWADQALGAEALRVATATSLVVMLGNAALATAATSRDTLAWLGRRRRLLPHLAAGGVLGAFLAPSLPAPVVRWAFVTYVAVTFADLVLRRGFLVGEGDRLTGTRAPADHALPNAVGVPIGAVATLLGVGGSVMTVPALRRAGASMGQATALANPLTFVIAFPAAVFTLVGGEVVANAPGLVGPVDLRAAAALLAGSLPVIVVLRRRPPPIPDRVHAVGYLVLLVASALGVALG